jgi:hypothetical protein
MLKHLAMHAATFHPQADFDMVSATPLPSPISDSSVQGALHSLRNFTGQASSRTAAGGVGDDTWTADDAAALQEAEQEAPTCCCNVVCALDVAKAGVDDAACKARLCSRCFRLLGTTPMPSTEQQAQATLAAIMKIYHLQLTKGCGKSGCCNLACATGTGSAMQAGPAAVTAMELCKTFTASRGGKLFMCVTTSRAPPGSLQRESTGVPVIDALRSELASSKQLTAAAAAGGGENLLENVATTASRPKRSSRSASMTFFG